MHQTTPRTTNVVCRLYFHTRLINVQIFSHKMIEKRCDLEGASIQMCMNDNSSSLLSELVQKPLNMFNFLWFLEAY